MDSYFQTVHRLPYELVTLIYEFATLRTELQEVSLNPIREIRVREYNVTFFRNWAYIEDQVDNTGSYFVYNSEGRVTLMYLMI